MFDILGDVPSFFINNNANSLGTILFASIVVFAPSTVMALGGWAVGGLWSAACDRLHVATVGLAAAVVLLMTR